MKIEIEKNGEGFTMTVNETRHFVFDSADKLVDRLQNEILLDEALEPITDF